MSRTIVERSTQNLVAMDVFSRLIQDRIIFIDDVITDEMCNGVVSQLLYLNSLSKDEITIYINSPGGSVYDGFAIIDTMERIKSPVKTVVIGKAMSMAAVIAVMGDVRQMTKRSTMMFHEMSAGIVNKMSEITTYYEELKRIEEVLYAAVKEKTKIKDIEQAFQKDQYYDAEKALSLGVIDEIL